MKHFSKVSCVVGVFLFLFGGKVWAGCSPILLDLDQDGFSLGPAGEAVRFDLDCDGFLENLQWVAAGEDEAFLSLDRNGNGVVDDGSELFGVGTPLVLQGGKARHGYQALRQYDKRRLGGNADGKIDMQDEVWSELRLWLDLNADGISTPDEMAVLSSESIVSLSLDAKKSRRKDAAGNWFALWSWATVDREPRKLRMVDVFFATVDE